MPCLSSLHFHIAGRGPFERELIHGALRLSAIDIITLRSASLRTKAGDLGILV